MSEEKPVKNFLRRSQKEKRPLESQEGDGYDVENNMKKMDVRCYRKIAGAMDVWKLILKEAKMLRGP
jgi:hypothetical protein